MIRTLGSTQNETSPRNGRHFRPYLDRIHKVWETVRISRESYLDRFRFPSWLRSLLMTLAALLILPLLITLCALFFVILLRLI